MTVQPESHQRPGAQIVTTRKEGIFDGVELFKWDFGALFAIPIIVFGFNCHANVRALSTLAPCSQALGADAAPGHLCGPVTRCHSDPRQTLMLISCFPVPHSC